jgi:hypothetical protein
VGLRRWRVALAERNALQEGRYGCPLGSLAKEFSDPNSVAHDKLHNLFMAWQELATTRRRSGIGWVRVVSWGMLVQQ